MLDPKSIPSHGNLEDPSVRAVLRWLDIRFENGMQVDSTHGLMVDMLKSSLLARLLAGKEPFEEVPPCSYSYPWYELMEKGKARCTEVHYCKTDLLDGTPLEHLAINQSRYLILENRTGKTSAEPEYICQHYKGKTKWLVRREGRDPEEKGCLGGQWAERWFIERLPNEEIAKPS